MELEVVQHLGRTSILELTLLLFFPRIDNKCSSLFSYLAYFQSQTRAYHVSYINVASELPFLHHIRWDSYN